MWRTNVHYMLWQVAALRRARRLARERRFDLIWHVTFANVWLGSAGALVGPPFVFGPAGGGVGPAWRLLPALGPRGAAYELTWAATRALGRFLNPLARLTWRRAALILAQNPQTKDWLPRRHARSVAVLPNVVLSEKQPEAIVSVTPAPSPTALFAGRLVAWKGPILALRAVARAPGWRLLVCGTGPEERRLRRIVSKLGLESRVELRGWVPRTELHRLMREQADVLLAPSIHEEGGWAVVEALACGLPVVCLDRGNPPLLGGPGAISVAVAGGWNMLASALAEALQGGLPSPEVARARADAFLLDERVERVRALLRERTLGP